MNDAAYMVGVILGAVVVGILCGLIPLLVGLKKDEKILAFVGFAACIICGFFKGLLLALPTALAFLAIIYITAKGKAGNSK